MRAQDCKTLLASSCLIAGAIGLFPVSGTATPESINFREFAFARRINFNAASQRTDPGRLSLPNSQWRPDTDMMPVRLNLSLGVVLAGETAGIDVTVSTVPPGGGYIQILCDTPGALTSPTGSWPYQVYYAGGSSATQSVAVTASNVLLPTIATLYTGDSHADPNDLTQWTVAATILILPGF